MNIKDFQQVSTHHWKYPRELDKSLSVDVSVFASRKILEAAIEDASIQQAINVGALPKIISHSLAMPDIHYGYGFCIGGVAAFPEEDGIVSPGGVGYDINCGVRVLTTAIPCRELDGLLDRLGQTILRTIPTGMTTRGLQKMGKKEFLNIIQNGSGAVVDHYGGDRDDLEYIESSGKLPFHNPDIISQRATERGRSQVGSLGSGNHFIEIQRIEEIFDTVTAGVFGLRREDIAIMIHTGSRGFGHQIATDYIEKIRRKNLHKISVRDPQLIYADIHSALGQDYLQALNAASNFAWANRHMLMEKIIGIFEELMGSSRKQLGIRLLYDQAHNIAKFETHTVDGRKRKLLVHRKGATRAFPPHHRDLPPGYRETGQPVMLPGSMGTASYILKGTPGAMALTFGSSAHGAGRRMSRHRAIKFSQHTDVRKELGNKNILAFSHSNRGLKEEIPEAYKEIDEVARITHEAGISEKVARLKPLVVIKG